jgi:hypothetical protein
MAHNTIAKIEPTSRTASMILLLSNFTATPALAG